jgi:hypothetical protein
VNSALWVRLRLVLRFSLRFAVSDQLDDIGYPNFLEHVGTVVLHRSYTGRDPRDAAVPMTSAVA